MTTLIHQATIVNEGEQYIGSVLIKDGRIARIVRGNDINGIEADHIVHAEGQYLIPGCIDDHVHFRDPGLTHKADMYTESRAAARGGVTSVMDMPNCNPQTTTIEVEFASLRYFRADSCGVNSLCSASTTAIAMFAQCADALSYAFSKSDNTKPSSIVHSLLRSRSI